MGPHKLSWSQKYYQLGSQVVWLAQAHSWTSPSFKVCNYVHVFYPRASHYYCHDSYSHKEPEHFIGDEIKSTIIYLSVYMYLCLF